jgi:hypothetical protein
MPIVLMFKNIQSINVLFSRILGNKKALMPGMAKGA